MQEQQHRFPIGIVVGLSTLVVATGSATAFFTWQSSQKSKAPTVAIEQSQPSPSNQPAPAAPALSQNQIKQEPKVLAPAAEKTAQVYWIRDRGTDLEVVPIMVKVKSDDREEALLTSAMNTLLESTPDKELINTIPKGTKLRSLKVKPNGIHIDLSKSFTSGGGAAAMQGRIAQVLYTATSLNPKAPVYLSVDGNPLTELGGEGLMIDQPLTRQGFEEESGAKTE
jgi:spore germination protein GerM